MEDSGIDSEDIKQNTNNIIDNNSNYINNQMEIEVSI